MGTISKIIVDEAQYLNLNVTNCDVDGCNKPYLRTTPNLITVWKDHR